MVAEGNIQLRPFSHRAAGLFERSFVVRITYVLLSYSAQWLGGVESLALIGPCKMKNVK